MFLLDTDHISILQREAGPEYIAILTRISQHDAMDLSFSVVSLHEQTLGCHADINRAHTSAEIVRGYGMLSRVIQAFSASPVLPFDPAAALVFDDLLARGLRVGAMDLRIAAIAISRDLTLVTRNLRDFTRIVGLRTEDWTL